MEAPSKQAHSTTHVFGWYADGRAGLDDAGLDDDAAHDRVALHEHVARDHTQLEGGENRILADPDLL